MEPQEVHPESTDVLVGGEQLQKLPEDLYIPPDALRVFLTAFQGPLDMLLYLIKKQNLDILEIPIVEITRQYLEYIDLMATLQMDLAAEYLVMAAMLAEIKSRLLLPRPVSDEEGEQEDPRAELVRRLQEYERFKNAAENLADMPRLDRDLHIADAQAPKLDFSTIPVSVDMKDIMSALAAVLKRATLYEHHKVLAEGLSVRDRMTHILSRVGVESFTLFTDLFDSKEGRVGVVVTLLAILELTRDSVLELVQSESFAEIYVKAKTNADEDEVVQISPDSSEVYEPVVEEIEVLDEVES